MEKAGGDADDRKQREITSGEVRGEGGAFNEIVFVRNALAHGTWPSHARRRKTLRQLIRDPERLPRQLQCWMAELKKQCGEAAAARTPPYER